MFIQLFSLSDSDTDVVTLGFYIILHSCGETNIYNPGSNIHTAVKAISSPPRLFFELTVYELY